jgi:hypothetical protein
VARSPAYAEELVDELRVESPYARLRLARDGEHFEGHGDFVVDKRPERIAVYAPHRRSGGHSRQPPARSPARG